MFGTTSPIGQGKNALKKVVLFSCFAVALAVVVIAGGSCTTPFGPADPCDTVVIDDNDPCTADSCAVGSNGEPVVAHTPIECPAGQVCDDGMCIAMPECIADEDCDDDDICTDDICDSNGKCENINNNASCDDGDLCTENDVCSNGICIGTEIECPAGKVCENGICKDIIPECTVAADCDDGLYCNGMETCVAGTCINGESPCSANEACDEAADSCNALPECDSNSDCDDGLYCSGAETCSREGTCVSGTNPCAPGQTCIEETDTCSATVSHTVILTTATDNLTGTSGDDIFDGARYPVGVGTWMQTLNNADNLDGGAGTDTLTAQLLGGGTTTPAGLTSIEVFNLEITDANDTTLNLQNAGSATTINDTYSGANLTVNNVRTVPTNVGLVTCNNDFTVTVDSAVLTGNTDSVTLAVSGVTDSGTEPAITLQPSAAGNGFETISLVSSGSSANSIDDLQDGVGNTFKALNISGTQDITIGDQLNDTVTTINAGGATGDVSVFVGTNTAVVTGGSGDDTFDFSQAAGDLTALDTVNGGSGTDTLRVQDNDVIGTAANQTHVISVETIFCDTTLMGNLNISHFGATNVKLAGIDGMPRTVTLPSGGSLELIADAGAANHIISVSLDTASDSLSVILDDADFGANVDLSTFENVSILSKTAPNTITGTFKLNNAGGTQTITVTGSQNLTFGGVITADTLNASAFTGVLDTDNAVAALAMTIIGGGDADHLGGSNLADSITGGAGADTINGLNGLDTLTGGDGADTFLFKSPAAANGNTITDFTAGASGDVLMFDISDLGLAGGTEHVGAIADLAADSSDEIVILTGAGYASVDAAEDAIAAKVTAGGALDIVVVFFNTTNNRTEIMHDADQNTDDANGTATLIGVLSNITTLTAHDTLVDANINSQP